MPRHATSTTFNAGKTNPNWKGGGVEYWRRQARKITNYPKGLIVHHIDKDVTNNDIKNLMVITQSEHVAIHNRERKGTHRKNTFVIKYKDVVLASNLPSRRLSKELKISKTTILRIRQKHNYPKENLIVFDRKKSLKKYIRRKDTLKIKYKHVVLKSILPSRALAKKLKISKTTILKIRKGGN